MLRGVSVNADYSHVSIEVYVHEERRRNYQNGLIVGKNSCGRKILAVPC